MIVERFLNYLSALLDKLVKVAVAGVILWRC